MIQCQRSAANYTFECHGTEIVVFVELGTGQHKPEKMQNLVNEYNQIVFFILNCNILTKSVKF